MKLKTLKDLCWKEINGMLFDGLKETTIERNFENDSGAIIAISELRQEIIKRIKMLRAKTKLIPTACPDGRTGCLVAHHKEVIDFEARAQAEILIEVFDIKEKDLQDHRPECKEINPKISFADNDFGAFHDKEGVLNVVSEQEPKITFHDGEWGVYDKKGVFDFVKFQKEMNRITKRQIKFAQQHIIKKANKLLKKLGEGVELEFKEVNDEKCKES